MKKLLKLGSLLVLLRSVLLVRSVKIIGGDLLERLASVDLILRRLLILVRKSVSMHVVLVVIVVSILKPGTMLLRSIIRSSMVSLNFLAVITLTLVRVQSVLLVRRVVVL